VGRHGRKVEFETRRMGFLLVAAFGGGQGRTINEVGKNRGGERSARVAFGDGLQNRKKKNHRNEFRDVQRRLKRGVGAKTQSPN